MNEAGENELSGESDWLPCRTCCRRTEHAVLRKVKLEDEGEEQQWQIVRCGGCWTHAFRQGSALTHWTHELDQEIYTDVCGETGEHHWEWTVYPEPEFRTEAVDKSKLPELVQRLYAETLIAFNHRAMTLAAAGLRAVVEATCLDKGCIKGDLKEKIEALVTQGVFLKRDADYLQDHRLFGNEAVHKMNAPPEEEFGLALEVLEHLLTTVYVIPLHIKEFRKLRQTRGAQVFQEET